MKRRTLARTIALIGVAALVTGCGGATTSTHAAAPSPSAQTKLIPLAIGYPAPAATFTTMFVAKQQGFFKKNGLDVSLHILKGSGSETAALLSGSVKVVLAEANSVLSLMAKGVKIKFVGSVFNRFPYEVWGQPSLASIGDLKGKRLGETEVRSAVAAAAQEVLAKVGLQPGSVRQYYLGNNAAEFAGLAAHKVDAAILVPPFTFKAKSQGFKKLYSLTHTRHLFAGILTTYRFIQNDPKTLRAFLLSYEEAVRFTKNPANEPQVLKAMTTLTNVTNHALLAKTYDFFVPLMPAVPTISRSEYNKSQQWVQVNEHKSVSWSQAVDLAPLQSLKSGAS